MKQADTASLNSCQKIYPSVLQARADALYAMRSYQQQLEELMGGLTIDARVDREKATETQLKQIVEQNIRVKRMKTELLQKEHDYEMSCNDVKIVDLAVRIHLAIMEADAKVTVRSSPAW